jgi:hypothetical protein
VRELVRVQRRREADGDDEREDERGREGDAIAAQAPPREAPGAAGGDPLERLAGAGDELRPRL